MNYINQLNIFFRLASSADLTSSARMLYVSLLHKNNTLAWIEKFTCSATELESLSGLSQSGLTRARKQLIDKQLIGYKKRKGRQAPEYSIPILDENVLLTILTGKAVNNPVNNTTNKAVNKPVTLTKLKKTKKEKDKKSAPQYGADSPYLKLAKYLFEQIKTNDEKRKVLTDSQEQKWANTIRLMAERDEHKPNQIRNMIDWSQQDDFWHKVILSPTKLRKHYDQMKLQALENDKESKPKYSNERSTETVSAERERARKLNELVNSQEVSLNE